MKIQIRKENIVGSKFINLQLHTEYSLLEGVGKRIKSGLTLNSP